MVDQDKHDKYLYDGSVSSGSCTSQHAVCMLHTFAYVLPHLEMHVSIKIHTSSLQHWLFRYKPHHDPDEITMTSSEVVEDIMKLLHVLIL